MFSALFPEAVGMVKSDTGGFIVSELQSKATGGCVEGHEFQWTQKSL